MPTTKGTTCTEKQVTEEIALGKIYNKKDILRLLHGSKSKGSY